MSDKPCPSARVVETDVSRALAEVQLRLGVTDREMSAAVAGWLQTMLRAKPLTGTDPQPPDWVPVNRSALWSRRRAPDRKDPASG